MVQLNRAQGTTSCPSGCVGANNLYGIQDVFFIVGDLLGGPIDSWMSLPWPLGRDKVL